METPGPAGADCAIDHLVLPVPSLALARERHAALGFTTAPDGVHPFGTRNACIYFRDGTFLEPLAIGDRAGYAAAAAQGNVFVLRDRLFREAAGDDGFSAIALASQDAAADHRRFVASQVSAGAMLAFERPFVTPGGDAATASFRLAFAALPREPALFMFACERAGVPAVDRTALERHANGAAGIAAILAVVPDRNAGAGLAGLPVSGGRIVTFDREGWTRRFGLAAPTGGATRLAGIVIEVDDLDRAAGFATGPVVRADGAILAHAGPGAAIFFAAPGYRAVTSRP